MREQIKPDEKFSKLTPTFAVVVLLAGLFVVQDTVFNPTRPSMMSTEIGSSEDVRSRLWQDPFQAVEAHRKKYHENKTDDQFIYDPSRDIAFQLGDKSIQRICKTDENKKVKAHSIEELNCQIDRDILRKDKSLYVLAVMAPGGPYAEDQEWRLRNRYALISGLDAAGYQPIDSEHIGFVDFEHGCRSTPSGESDENKKKKYFCSLPAYMPYEWFELDQSSERRIKNINGLKEISASPINEKNNILVLWLNNDTFSQNGRILESLAWLKRNIILKKTEISFNVIGPVDSGTLKKMDKEMADLEKNSKNDFLTESLIISPFASIDDKQLFPKDSSFEFQVGKFYDETLKKLEVEQYKNEAITEINGVLSTKITVGDVDKKEKITEILIPHLKNKYPHETNKLEVFLKDLQKSGSKLSDNNPLKTYKNPTNNTIVRTITTHSKLANTLLCELALRGVRPDPSINSKCGKLSGFSLKNPHRHHHIILIGEIDTNYSQTLTKSILQEIEKFGFSSDKKFVHTFNYLRGLDGITTERPSNSQKSDKNKSSETNKLSGQETKERPIGPSQLDYLLGLAERIKYLDKMHATDGGIKAIGITGSDAYDKLLILQALRKQFPDVLFFTTDLDARLVHSTETKWTRNLIVASPFGLQLNDEWQQHTPFFRDSYQTSLYLATLFAIRCSNGQKQCPSAELDEKINNLIGQPRLFEVGNHGAVDLSHTSGNSIHPAPEFTFKSEDSFKKSIFQLVAMTIFMLFLLYLVPKKLGYVTVKC